MPTTEFSLKKNRGGKKNWVIEHQRYNETSFNETSFNDETRVISAPKNIQKYSHMMTKHKKKHANF